MKKSGTADLALFGGGIPPWLYDRMVELCLPIVESIVSDRGTADFLSRMSDPFWFQSFGAVIGMDWNSSGVTTAVMRALKDAIKPHSSELGLYICGGKGKESMRTPQELQSTGDKTGLDGQSLARSSKLVAKVDNTAIQDGYNLYLHSFIVDTQGAWTVVQQGMDSQTGMARRYHWHSAKVKSFVEDPHSAVCGSNLGDILNLTAVDAKPTQNGILDISKESPNKMVAEIAQMTLPTYCDVKAKDVDLKRLGSVLWLAQEQEVGTFEDLLLVQGLGPRTLQSLTLVSEVIHGTPSRFTDPARFSFAHGGKNSNPFPIATKIYDETIEILSNAVHRAKIGSPDKSNAIAKLHKIAKRAEEGFLPNDNFEAIKAKQNRDAWKYGGRTLRGYSKPPKDDPQLRLF